MGVFKSVEECIELYKKGVPCDTGFSFFYNAEGVDFNGNGEYVFDIDGDIQAQLEEIEGNTSMVIADDNTQPYAEFSFVICPAYANTVTAMPKVTFEFNTKEARDKWLAAYYNSGEQELAEYWQQDGEEMPNIKITEEE